MCRSGYAERPRLTPRTEQMTALLSMLDRHPLYTGWIGTSVSGSVYFAITLQQVDLALDVAVKFLTAVSLLLTVAITLRKWVKGPSKH